MRVALASAAAAALAVLVSACGGTEGTAASGASVIPADVPAFISINSDPDSDQWQKADDLASKFPDKQKAVDSIKKEMRQDDVSWEKDIKPALGPEVDIVWLDFANGGENIVGLMQPKDEAAFRRTVEKGNASEEDPSDRLLYEKFHGWMVMSNKQALIDRFKQMSAGSNTSLEDNDSFNDAMATGSDDALIKAYLNGRIATNEIVKAADPDARSIILQFGKLDWLASTLAAEDDGAKLDLTVHGTPGKLFKGVRNVHEFEAKLPNSVPKDVILYYTFHGTKDMWSGFESNPLFQSPEVKPALNVLKQIGTLLQGENALYVRRGNGGHLPEITLVAEPQKGKSGRATLDRIVNKFAIDLGVAPMHRKIAGSPGTALDFGEFGLFYADVGDRLVVSDVPGGIAGFKKGGPSLDDNSEYKNTLDAAGMPDKTHGFVYVDIHAGTALGERLAGAPIPAEVKRNLRPLRSAVEYAVSQSHQVSVDVFLRIK